MPIPGHGSAAPAAPPAPGTPAAPPAGGPPATAPTTTPVGGVTHAIQENKSFFWFPVLIVVGIIVGHIGINHIGWLHWWLGGVIGFAVAAILFIINYLRSPEAVAPTPAAPAAPPAPGTSPAAPPAAPAAPATPANPTNPGLAGSWTDPVTNITWWWDLARWWRWDATTSTWV